MISAQDMVLFAKKALGLRESVAIEFFPLEGRGSDRTFFRARWHQEGSAILISYDPKRVENSYYAEIAEFLRTIGVSVPQLIRHDPTSCLIAMEDLGDTDLWSLRKEPWEIRRTLYLKTLATACKLHSFPERDFPSNRVRIMEGFSSDLYRWERDYFKEHFVKAFCGVELETSFEQELEAELSRLAERLLRTMRCLVHRDLQSQNIMIRDGEPFLLDFQGMRFGTPFYDLASLLCDPYVSFSDRERGELLSHYYRIRNWDLDWDNFQKAFWEASAQRLMQALGAYGFLGLKKALKAYLRHIPSGLCNLSLATSQVPTLSRLRELCSNCQRAIEKKEAAGNLE